MSGLIRVGKQVFDDLYIHLDAVPHLADESWRARVRIAHRRVIESAPQQHPNVAKLNLRSGKISLLAYTDFEEDAFPELAASWRFTDDNSVAVLRRYDTSLNPPILHRKELLVPPDHPTRGLWEELTRTAESLGLFDENQSIGFKLNWERLIRSKGYEFVDGAFRPIGNETESDRGSASTDARRIQRHLTALVRTNLSAPVQLLLRHGLLSPEVGFFDYGCGRGGDLQSLSGSGFKVAGWDPHYAPNSKRVEADVVNLGFVINVIEDPAERIDAVRGAFKLTRGVLAVSVMLYGPESSGRSYGDGVITSRNTFQKYFAQSELQDYLEQVLHHPVHMAGPGVAFVFKDIEWEQRYSSGRYKSSGVADRLLMARVARVRPPKPQRESKARTTRQSKSEVLLAKVKPYLDEVWRHALDLGRWPDPEELAHISQPHDQPLNQLALRRLIDQHYDLQLLRSAASTRADDLCVFFAAQQFERRPAYRQLEARLQRDVKAFFGDYRSAQTAGLHLLQGTGSTEQILSACRQAAEQGLGWLDGEHSLQLHIDLVERLPALLRAYVTCGLVLWNSIGDVNLVKIHVTSGKLTFLEYDNFDGSPVPLLKRRVKLNLRKLDYDVFEYGSVEYPKPPLYHKSRYMNEDQQGYAEQLAFDESLDALGLVGSEGTKRSARELEQAIQLARRQVQGMALVPSSTIPDIDQACGANFTYRSFTECGETQQRLKLANIPLRAESYNALYDLATQILDPLIDYFGAIRLTYGFSSAALAKNIPGRIAPELDQHAACEHGHSGKPICSRGGAACDFIVDDENMRDVAEWIVSNLPFDRLYFYGDERPLHVSFAPSKSRAAYEMRRTSSGRLVPRPFGQALSTEGPKEAA